MRPFTDKQIELVKNFAAQAVIAIENARLLNELRAIARTADRNVEVLSVISSSPGELEPVFQAMLENATRICDANFGNMFLVEGDIFRTVAHAQCPGRLLECQIGAPFRPPPGSDLGRLIATKNVVHIADLRPNRTICSGSALPSKVSNWAAFGRYSLCQCSRTTRLSAPSSFIATKSGRSPTSRSRW